MNSSAKAKVIAAGLAVLALLAVPAPLLPAHRLAEGVQSTLKTSWKAAYLVTAIGLQTGFYGSLGVLAALAVKRAPTRPGRLLQLVLLPIGVIGGALLIRSLKLGELPPLANAVLPAGACLFGVGLGLGLLYRGWKLTLPVAGAVVGVTLWMFLSGASAELSHVTELNLRRLLAAGPSLPAGESRFGALLESAFAPLPADAPPEQTVLQNRAAILALGITLGHERLARFVGLNPTGELVRAAIALRPGTTLRGRGDWSRHYCLSAALAVLEGPLVSDSGGVIKEQLDALAGESGFSFGDLAADRAGVRFAQASTSSETAARGMRRHLASGFAVNDFFPETSELPENLTMEQFRTLFGGAGSPRYRQMVSDIEARIDRCPALSNP